MLNPTSFRNLNSAAGSTNSELGLTALTQSSAMQEISGTEKTQSLASTINVYSSVIQGIGNALGLRSPYYKIGEIPGKYSDTGLGGIANTTAGLLDKYASNYSSLVRAITKDGQEGVIVDCLGDMDGTWSVDFTQNPVFYGTATATNSRVRKPAQLKAQVFISNYLTDNAIEGLVASLENNVLGTNILSNALLYDGNTRAQQGLAKLIYLMENGEPFTVYTPHGLYENMLIKDISVVTNDKTMDMMHATIQFEEAILTRPYYSGGTAATIPGRKVIDAASDTKIQRWERLEK